MDIANQRKCYNLRISARQSKKNPRFIFNQTTLVGSLCNLMKNEKVVVALVRIQNKSDAEQTIPLGFKVHRNKIPIDIKPDRIHTNNIVQVQVFGSKPITSMIVCIGGK